MVKNENSSEEKVGELLKLLEQEKGLLQADITAFEKHSRNFHEKIARVFNSF